MTKDLPTSADELFEGRIETIETLTDRKRVIADPDLYRTLYYVYQSDVPVYRDKIRLDEVKPLFDNNLLAIVPKSDDPDEVRITRLGADEIEADLHNLGYENQDNKKGIPLRFYRTTNAVGANRYVFIREDLDEEIQLEPNATVSHLQNRL